ncbi:hypothetical protein C477_01795 [Haloterrigena salina JCM 13891]|uniref:Uncharacterized protein n=1 Tax=Haloterrigena salina JCM 13891 TaxID=1227488 RepID=M0CKW1_9EURY|nr:hypothetical protein C477_01795 [Haloterrigena salina JCM 13891]
MSTIGNSPAPPTSQPMLPLSPAVVIVFVFDSALVAGLGGSTSKGFDWQRRRAPRRAFVGTLEGLPFDRSRGPRSDWWYGQPDDGSRCPARPSIREQSPDP